MQALILDRPLKIKYFDTKQRNKKGDRPLFYKTAIKRGQTPFLKGSVPFYESLEMKPYRAIIFTALAAALIYAGCAKKQTCQVETAEAHPETAKKEVKKEEVKAEPAAPEPAPVLPPASLCDSYARCCLAYADMVAGISSMSVKTLDTVKQSCHMVKKMKDIEGSEKTCGIALEAMIKAVKSAEGSVPGFILPDACRLPEKP